MMRFNTLLAFVATVFISCFTFAQNNSLAYQISSPNTKTAILFGTIHAIPDSLYFFPKKLEKLVSKSELVVMEIENVQDKTKAQSLLKLNNGTSCFDIFNPSQKDSVINWGAKILGITPEQFVASFKDQKPFVLLQLTMLDLMKGNVKMYETEIAAMANKNAIPIGGLETMEFQLSIFNNMNDEHLAKMILETIRDTESSKKVYNHMVQLYTKFQIDELAKLINESSDLGSYSAQLVDNRNEDWIPKMEKLMHEKACFFAVGAGHLGGENGVISLLKEKGYSVTPIKL